MTEEYDTVDEAEVEEEEDDDDDYEDEEEEDVSDSDDGRIDWWGGTTKLPYWGI